MSKQRLLLTILKFVVLLGTFPYYRLFQFNTLGPILRIAAYSSQPGQSRKVLQILVRWRTRKIAELQFISIAVSRLFLSNLFQASERALTFNDLKSCQCAILAAAVIGSFSWTAAFDAYWLAPSLWYSSLVLSILGLLLSTQQISVLYLLDTEDAPSEPGSNKMDIGRYLPLMLTEVRQHSYPVELQRNMQEIKKWRPRWKMVFTWQCPIMFMSYSVCSYLAGLTIYVCTPLIRGDGWNAGSNVSLHLLVLLDPS